MNAPASLNATGHHAPSSLGRRSSTCYYDSSDDADSDDGCRLHHHHRQQQQQNQQLWLPPRSLQRILGPQRNLRLRHSEQSATLEAHTVWFPTTGTHRSVSHSSPVPGTRLAARASRARSPDRPNALLPRGQAPPRARTASVSGARMCPYEELYVPADRPSQSPAQAAVRADPPLPAPALDTSKSQSASGGVGHSRRPTMTVAERRVARTCTIDGCTNYIVDRHLCFRHGGGKRCSIDGCASSAKQFGLCWRHGGSVLCKIEGCTRGVKVNGFCWGHGGGKKKNQQATSAAEVTVAVRQDSAVSPVSRLRCLFDGCQKTPVLSSFCEEHCRKVTRPGYVFEL